MSYRVLSDQYGVGGPVIRVVGLGDFIRFEAHNAALVVLSDQLKHQTERAEMAEIFIENLAPELGAGATIAEVVDRVAQWLDADHGERLAEVRAEAGRAGYFLGHRDAGGIDNAWGLERSTRYADEYAAKVRGGKE